MVIFGYLYCYIGYIYVEIWGDRCFLKTDEKNDGKSCRFFPECSRRICWTSLGTMDLVSKPQGCEKGYLGNQDISTNNWVYPKFFGIITHKFPLYIGYIGPFLGISQWFPFSGYVGARGTSLPIPWISHISSKACFHQKLIGTIPTDP